MPTELVIEADYQGGMKLTAGDGEHSVTIDYPLEPGQAVDGLTPLKLLLVSLAGCIGNTVPMLLAKRGQPVRGLQVTARGQRRDEHPSVFTSIDVEFVLHGADLDPEVVEHCITLADEKLCPVWAMIRPATPITTTYRIED
jgi:putative redox protein